MALGATIRMGAVRYDIETDDGTIIDLSRASKAETRRIRRLIRNLHEKQKDS